ncbi:MAG TPA: two-component regulator propeller domain-containing protein, partial [Thermoanaerobaculia bacterium]|nr:two-component regulator propeller domain-containing protein [Thermoanaerobaculia bacterium]
GRITMLGRETGLGDGEVNAIGEDPAGNLWVGSDLRGALRITPGGLTSFGRAHGLPNERINSIFETGDGRLCVTSGGTEFLSCFEPDGTLRVTDVIPPAIRFNGWGWRDVITRDRDGDWWVATGQGAIRWSGDFKTHKATYDSTNGLGGDDVFRIWQDRRGDLWFSTFGKRVLTRRDRATGAFTHFDETHGLPLSVPTAFIEDRHGTIWMGLYGGGIVRFDGKRFELLDERHGIPDRFVRDFLIDSKGRLWIATHGGVARIDDPAAKQPRVKAYTERDGLTMTGAYCLAEGADGRVAIGTPRGVDLLDVATGDVTRLTTRDGLAHNEVVIAHRDRHGALWFGTLLGLSRLAGTATKRASAPPRPHIDAIGVGGKPVAVAELGAYAIDSLRLEPPERRVTIAFSAPDFDVAHPIRFEYRLGDDGPWTDAGKRREVSYERLPFGSHRFEVRTIATDGRRSMPATVGFRAIAPFWRTWWFTALVAAVVIALAVVLHRLRVAHLLALQRVRTRVATDLHDDLGSSLSRISILSELAKSRAPVNGTDERLLDEIGDTARGLVDSLGDSIWSIDPRRDDVRSLLSRLRHFAADVLEAKSIAMDFRVPQDLSARYLDPQRRREVYLILKEALTNAARHSEARKVAVTAHVDDRRLHIAVEDDGKGFRAEDAAVPREDGGRGLPNMTARAERAGGRLVVGSRPGVGTRVELTIPV